MSIFEPLLKLFAVAARRSRAVEQCRQPSPKRTTGNGGYVVIKLHGSCAGRIIAPKAQKEFLPLKDGFYAVLFVFCLQG